jgi:hypothetical protein
MERSEIRDFGSQADLRQRSIWATFPDCASLHPGYEKSASLPFTKL